MTHTRLVVTALLIATVLTGAASPAMAQTSASRDTQREGWQRIPDIFAAMGIAPGAVVADVGAGDGYFTVRLAKAVGPAGRVYAVDVAAATVDRLRGRMTAEGFSTVDVILGTAADPKLPDGSLDAALIINAYHEMREHQAMLAALRRALKPTGRLVIVEPIAEALRGAPRASQESRHQIAPQYVEQDAIAAGFLIAKIEDPFTTRGGHEQEYLLTLTPTPPPSAAPPAPLHDRVVDDAWRKPDEVVAALQLRPGQVIVDLGAGSGVFTRRFARVVGPAGRAIGLDVNAAAVEAMRKDATDLGLANYDARVVGASDPAIPPGSADVIFLSNAYHHIEDRAAYFGRLRAALKPGGRLVIVDFTPDALGSSGLPGHADRVQAEAELTRAGYRLQRAHTFLERQFFLEFIVERR